jgi:hypothetical protein
MEANMRESPLERKAREAVERIGGKMPKWVSPGNRGVPDRLVILPDGRTIYVEMKAPGKPLEPLQRKWRKTLLGLGHQHYKIDSEADIEQFIREVMPK